ncbi:MAP7 domain-containing protein 2-like [Mytilus edulis]|uniref:MAP7 domain-containing protein 2-like n=1 Tax=Mytilus edulis TaxID=6550 RepID=UPI0039EFC113
MMSSKEGLERYKQEKLQKRREQRLESYYRNRNLKENEYALSDEAVRQKQHREKQEKEQMRRVKETERKRKYRKRKHENINDQRQNENLNKRNTFENRTEKHRTLKKLKLALPKSPDRRVTTMVAYLQNSNSPTVRKLQSSEVISSPEEIEEHKTSKALTEDLKTVIDICI